ncbi:MAG: HAMP domain-containing sensor histidine kinase [Eubacteriales bacterium]
MNSFYKKQLLMVLFTVSLAFCLFTAMVISISHSYIIMEIEHKAQKNAQFAGAYTSLFLENHDISNRDFEMYLKTMARVTDSFLFLTPLEGDVSYATDGINQYPIRRNDVSRAVVDTILENGEIEEYTDLGGIFTEERYIYGTVYTLNVGGVEVPQGFVIFSPNNEQIHALEGGFVQVLFFLVIFLAMMTMVLVGYTSRLQAKPLIELAQAANRFGQGDLSVRIIGYEKREDEVGDMVRDFNMMASSIAMAEEHRSTFINNLSHELRTPMTTISGFAEGLLDGTVPVHKREKALGIIRGETQRLSRLVQQMIELSRMEGEEYTLMSEPFDFVELLAQVIIGMEGKITSRNLDVDVDIPQGEIMVMSSGDGITQVCYNLLDNAIKFATEESVIRVLVEVKDKKVFVSVINQGEVMNEEELPQLFQRFHKRDSSRRSHPEGMGLGLSIVKSILWKLQEDITVTTDKGETCFTFTLSLV